MNYQVSLKPGDVVSLRGGKEGSVFSVSLDNSEYPIIVRFDDGRENTYTADGKFQSGRMSDLDIVGIVSTGNAPKAIVELPYLDSRDYFIYRMGGVL